MLAALFVQGTGQIAVPREQSAAVKARFWVRTYDAEQNLLRLEPVHSVAILVRPEVQYPRILRKQGEAVECKFYVESQLHLNAADGSEVRVHKTVVDCDGQKMIVTHTLLQGEPE